VPPRTAASGCAGYPAATWSSWPSRPGASVTGWVRRLEGVLLAGLTPHNFDEALRSLLGIAQELLPGDRADILLLDDSGDASCRGQARAPAPRHVTAARWRSATACSAASPRRRVAATGTRALIAPRFLDIHRINETHEHIGLIYWARPTIVAAAPRPSASETHGQDARATLATEEHHDIRWCSVEDLEKLSPPMTDAVKWYCRQAIEEISRA